MADEDIEKVAGGPKDFRHTLFTYRPTAYATNGITVPCNFAGKLIDGALVQVTGNYKGEVTEGGVSGNALNVLLRVGSTGAEVSNATNLSGILLKCLAKWVP